MPLSNVPKGVVRSWERLRGRSSPQGSKLLKPAGVKPNAFALGELDWVSQQVKGQEQLAKQREFDAGEFDVEYDLLLEEEGEEVVDE